MPRECLCGSGERPVANFDGYRIFLFYSCSECHEMQLRAYRSDIFERYDTDEPIEEC